MITKIYGASDDLIEIDGAITDELDVLQLSTWEQLGERVGFSASDGTKGKITYGFKGIWKITLEKSGDKFKALIGAVGHYEAHIGDAAGCSPYSDVLILNEGIEWVKIGRKFFKIEMYLFRSFDGQYVQDYSPGCFGSFIWHFTPHILYAKIFDKYGAEWVMNRHKFLEKVQLPSDFAVALAKEAQNNKVVKRQIEPPQPVEKKADDPKNE